MATALTSAEVFVALVVAAHAAVLALRLSISLYEALSLRYKRTSEQSW